MQVSPESNAAEVGILAGDLVWEVNGKSTHGSSFSSLLPGPDSPAPIKLKLRRTRVEGGAEAVEGSVIAVAAVAGSVAEGAVAAVAAVAGSVAGAEGVAVVKGAAGASVPRVVTDANGELKGEGISPPPNVVTDVKVVLSAPAMSAEWIRDSFTRLRKAAQHALLLRGGRFYDEATSPHNSPHLHV